ncbi:hypothetical protein [Mariniblastus fucicola]|uniref:Uncharacterized protein n=1 Tax=Mariniblastus fucicola TaxID=980251 RepID=A0A5B9PGZ2_9BACT|nr:hypothetical protein [Mariniblastus fucicola]QEG24869.1 hypothetical protein MFFC18_47920 [Mariniblastus fucicola]
MLLSIDVEFEGDVQIESSAFALQTTGSTPVDLTFATSNSSRNTIASLSFSGNNTEATGSLVDGNYQLTINGDGVVDSPSNSFDLDRDGIPGGQIVFGDEDIESLYRLFDDVNQSRRADIFDLLGFRQTYLKTLVFDNGFS